MARYMGLLSNTTDTYIPHAMHGPIGDVGVVGTVIPFLLEEDIYTWF